MFNKFFVALNDTISRDPQEERSILPSDVRRELDVSPTVNIMSGSIDEDGRRAILLDGETRC